MNWWLCKLLWTKEKYYIRRWSDSVCSEISQEKLPSQVELFFFFFSVLANFILPNFIQTIWVKAQLWLDWYLLPCGKHCKVSFALISVFQLPKTPQWIHNALGITSGGYLWVRSMLLSTSIVLSICQRDQRHITGNFLGIIPMQSEWQFLISLKLAYLQFIFYIGSIHLLSHN